MFEIGRTLQEATASNRTQRRKNQISLMHSKQSKKLMNSRKENGGAPGKQSKTQKRTKETGKKKAVEREICTTSHKSI